MHIAHNFDRASRTAAIALLLALGVGQSAPRAFAGDVPTQKYRDSTYKFALLYPDDWSPIPIEAGDRDLVCRFAQRDASAKGVAAARLSVLRTGPPLVEVAVTPGSDDPPAGGDDKTYADVVDIMNETLKDSGYDTSIDRAAGKPLKSRDGVPGRVWAFEAKSDDYAAFHFFAVWKKPDGPTQVGMWMRCAAAQRKHNEPMFRAIAASFQWFDEKAKETTSLDVLKDLPIPPAKRREIEKGLVKGWNVIVSPKKNYIVIYNTMGKRNDQLAKMIAERIEQIREQLYEIQFPPVRKIETVSVVRICGSRDEYRAYGGPGGTAGYWSPGDEELVFYDSSPAKKLDEDTLSVCYHEAFHQYIHYSTGEIDPHSWFNEGHGDYYAGARAAGGRFRILPFAWRVGTVKAAIRAGPSPKKPDGRFNRTSMGYTPLQDLVRFSQDEYYAYPTISYAQGWSLIYFLREIVPKNPAWKAKWGSILETYFTTLKGTVPPPAPAKPAKPAPPAKPDPAPPGMDAPAPPAGDEGDPTEDNPGIARPPPRGEGGGDIYKALEDAFKGIDWKEFEDAWKSSTLSISG